MDGALQPVRLEGAVLCGPQRGPGVDHRSMWTKRQALVHMLVHGG